MKTSIQLSLIFIFSFLFISIIYGDAEKKTVEEIIKKAGSLNSVYIETEGFIIHYVPETQNSPTSYYLLKGYYGDTLKVNTAEAKPEINQKYSVWGILYVERIFKNGKWTYSPFLSEKSKICLSCPPPSTETTTLPPPVDYTLYYIIGGAVVLMVGFFAFVKVRNRNNHKPSDWETPTLTTDYSNIPKTETPPPYYPTQPDTDFKTVKINTTPSKTMRLIPGRLEIINGEDKGKTFLIQGYPTKEGSIVTVGRETITGEKSHSHIQIDQHYQTVSRKQAEIIYKDRKLFVRNLSETNITEVDGQELRLGETVEIRPESIIKMGEIEFQYKV